MFETNEFSDWHWQVEADAREKAAAEREARDMRKEDSSPTRSKPCCSNPENYAWHQCLDRDPDTGAFAEDFYTCLCGSRICTHDYELICRWADRQSTWPAIDQTTAGPIVPQCDTTPILTLRKKVA